MHIEYREFLRQVLSRIQLDTSSSENLLHYSAKIEVTDCPDEERGVLASNVLFEISAAIREGAEEQGSSSSPLELAELVLRQIEEMDADAQLFVVQVGGPGFLNAKLQDEFYLCFLNSLSKKGADVLFHGKSFLSPVENKPLSSDSSFAINQFSVDWSQLLKRHQARENADIGAFISWMHSTDNFEVDDQLMLLGLLADREIDLEVYRSGLKGSQNLPWLFSKFSEDSQNFIDLSFKRLGVDIEKNSESAHNSHIEDLEQICCTAEVLPVVSELLSFRQDVFTAYHARRPDVFLKTLLRKVKLFYSFYNRPEYRELSPKRFTAEEMYCNLFLCRLLREVVIKSIDLLEFPCDKEKIV